MKWRRCITASDLRKKLGMVDRAFDVPLAFRTLGVRGSVTLELTLADGRVAPFSHEFAPAPQSVYDEPKVQSARSGLLIRETYHKPERSGLLCSFRSNRRAVALGPTEEGCKQTRQIVAEAISVIRTGGRFPSRRPAKRSAVIAATKIFSVGERKIASRERTRCCRWNAGRGCLPLNPVGQHLPTRSLETQAPGNRLTPHSAPRLAKSAADGLDPGEQGSKPR